jgi:hypothetical protein
MEQLRFGRRQIQLKSYTSAGCVPTAGVDQISGKLESAGDGSGEGGYQQTRYVQDEKAIDSQASSHPLPLLADSRDPIVGKCIIEPLSGYL